jgi:hypothetical protein
VLPVNRPYLKNEAVEIFLDGAVAFIKFLCPKISHLFDKSLSLSSVPNLTLLNVAMKTSSVLFFIQILYLLMVWPLFRWMFSYTLFWYLSLQLVNTAFSGVIILLQPKISASDIPWLHWHAFENTYVIKPGMDIQLCVLFPSRHSTSYITWRICITAYRICYN